MFELEQLAQSVAFHESDEQVICDISLPKTHALFDQHFEAFSLLPGVVQVHWVGRVAERWFSAEQFLGLERFKFKEPILPGMAIQLVLNKAQKKSGDGVVKFEYLHHLRKSEKPRKLSSGRMIFSSSEKGRDDV